MAGKHGANWLDSYVAIHEKNLLQLEKRGYVVENCLVLEAIGDDYWIRGVVRCRDGIWVKANKELVTVQSSKGRKKVQTRTYSYHAHHNLLGPLFRYDSGHGDHNDYHHKHIYDPLTDGPKDLVKLDWETVPHLSEVIDEAVEWYDENRAAIEAKLAEIE